MASDFIFTIIAIIISAIILVQYELGYLSELQALLIGYVTQAYYIAFIGQTISTLFIVFIYLILIAFVRNLLTGTRLFISKSSLALLLLPIFSIVLCYWYYNLHDDILETSQGNPLLVNFSIYYVKFYLFLAGIAWIASRDKEYGTLDKMLTFASKLSIYSCWVALFQLFIHMSVGYKTELIPTKHGGNGYILDLILGLKPYHFEYNNLQLTRVNAFFYEPKELAGFLALMLPYFLFNKRYFHSFLLILVGILTYSSTFYVGVLVSFIIFVLLRNITSIRLNVVSSIVALLVVVLLSLNLSDYFIDSLAANKDTIVYKLIAERFLNRLDFTSGTVLAEERKDFFGIPLQADLELPVVNFMRDNISVFLIGHGLGNATLVPNEYFAGTIAYEMRLTGEHKGHMNMGWLYYISQMGILFFICYFMLMTNVSFNSFGNKYYAFAICLLFICRIDILLVIMYGIGKQRVILSKRADEQLESVTVLAATH
jgi:hypothetical protein